MRKTALLALAAVIFGVAPIFASENPAETTVQTVAPATKSAVKKLTDDTAIRPGYKKNRLVVIDFNATWCGPCKQFAPTFDSVASKYADKVDFISIDIDRCPQTANAFGIEAVPTVLFIYPDGTVKTYVGTGEITPTEKFDILVKANISVVAVTKKIKE